MEDFFSILDLRAGPKNVIQNVIQIAILDDLDQDLEIGIAGTEIERNRDEEERQFTLILLLTALTDLDTSSFPRN